MRSEIYKYRIKEKNNKRLIFDIVRKKYVVLTPEESVRQYLVHYLVYEKGYPRSMIAIEKKLVVNSLEKRADIVCYDSDGIPNLLIECKSPDIVISQSVFDQAAIYNLTLGVKYLAISNGKQTLCCEIDQANSHIFYLDEIPAFEGK